MVLGRGANQARPADVDLFDGLVKRDVGPGDRGLERIEVHDHQLERQNAVLGQGLQVVGPVVPRQDTAVDLGVQRLDPAVEHLRKAGVLGHVADGDAGRFKKLSRAAGAEDFDARGRQRRRKIAQS